MAVQTAMESNGILDHTIVHGVFVGLARSGKDSLMKRLLGKKLSSTSPSTGVAENSIQVKVIAANIEESCWTEMDSDDEAIKMMAISTFCKMLSQKQLRKHIYPEGIAVEASVTMPTHQDHDIPRKVSVVDPTIGATIGTSITDPVRNDHKKQAYPSGSDESLPPVRAVVIPDLLRNVLKGALQRKGVESLKQYFHETWSLYLTNTGGQTEFQEVLPLLVSGPSMFFFTFRLDRDLNEHYSIEYELATGGKSYPYTATCTTIEGILQTLASISAMGTFVYHGRQKREVPLQPKVFFVGTHKDELDPDSAASHIASIDKQLQEVINSTSHIEELVEFASPSQLIFTVNNFSENDSDFQSIRSAIERVVMRGEFQMTSPAHWLIFSLALRNLDSHVISYDLCFNIAKQCGITNQEELNEALHFIHSKMGIIRYFPYEGVNNLVIIDPQFLFDKVTELIVDTFTFEKVGKPKMDKFKNRGIFSMNEFEAINAKSQSEITSSQFRKLLVHLRIAAPLRIDGEEKLFLPCVLAHAKISANNSMPLSTQVPSILVTFECGYIPNGVPGALIKYLISNEMDSSIDWIPLTDEIFKNEISFSGAYDTIVIRILPTHFEISCIPDSQFINARYYSIEETCDEVLKAINVGIPQILRDFSYIKRRYALTFQCPLPNCKHKHKTQVLMDKSGCPCTLFCQIAKRRCTLPENSYYWGYGKKPHWESGARNATQPSTRSQHTQIATTQLQTASNIQLTPLSTELQGGRLEKESQYNTQTVPSQSESQPSLTEKQHSIILDQLHKHSPDWKIIGRHLEFLPCELDNIQARPLLLPKAPDSWLSVMLQEWLQWAPGDSRGSKDFATLENLKLALLKAKFGATAHSLHI